MKSTKSGEGRNGTNLITLW